MIWTNKVVRNSQAKQGRPTSKIQEENLTFQEERPVQKENARLAINKLSSAIGVSHAFTFK
jgi:hypothetical protein